MYIMTKDNSFINLDHYCRVEICLKDNIYRLRGILPTVSETQRLYDDIAEFDKEEDAAYIFNVVYNNLTNREHICNLSSTKLLSDLWDQVKQSIPEEVLARVSLDELKLCVSGLRKIVILYPYKNLKSAPVGIEEANNLASKLKEKLESHSPIGGKWDVKAEKS